LDFAENFSRGVLVIEGIADLFDGDLLFGNSVLGPNDSAKTTLAAYFEQFEIMLYTLPLVGQLNHLSSLVPQHPTLAFVLAG
jgi:hypothetical protein